MVGCISKVPRSMLVTSPYRPSRIVKLINKKGQLKSSVIIDELPTIYFKGLDNLIATARSNKVAVCLGFQDFSQLVRDYGDKEAKVVINTVGNISVSYTHLDVYKRQI